MANRRRIDWFYFRSKLGWDLLPFPRISFYRSTHIVYLEIDLVFLCYGLRIYFFFKDTWTDLEKEMLSSGKKEVRNV